MTVAKEVSLKEFPFWCGAISNAKLLTHDELDAVERCLEAEAEARDVPFTETEVNDIFWFDFESFVLPILGLDPETVEKRGV